MSFKIPRMPNGDIGMYSDTRATLVDNFVFEDSLTLHTISSNHMYFTSNTTRKNYMMFVCDFLKMLPSMDVYRANISGKFTYSKRGNVFGIIYVP